MNYPITCYVTIGDDDGDGESGEAEEKLPSCMDYVMHFLTIFWKVLFAFVPPTGKLAKKIIIIIKKKKKSRD